MSQQTNTPSARRTLRLPLSILDVHAPVLDQIVEFESQADVSETPEHPKTHLVSFSAHNHLYRRLRNVFDPLREPPRDRLVRLAICYIVHCGGSI